MESLGHLNYIYFHVINYSHPSFGHVDGVLNNLNRIRVKTHQFFEKKRITQLSFASFGS